MRTSRLRAYQDPTYEGPAPSRIPWLWLVIIVALAIVPVFASELQLRRFAEVVILVLAVLGINLCTGFGGMVSLGHGVFVGIGAFAMAVFLDDLALPLPIALILATGLAGLAGVAVGLPALRVKGIYLALVTFGFALVFAPLVRRLGRLTGGPSGRPVEFDTTPPSWTGLDPGRTQLYNYLVCLVAVCFWLFLVQALVHSRAGRALRAVRDDELAAVTFGVDLTTTKTIAFGISAAMAGTAGALQAFLFPFVSHTSFDVFLSLELYAAAVVGGLGVIVGSVYGLIVLLLVPVLAGVLGFLGSETVIFGLTLIVLTYVAPRGIAGLVDDLVERIESRRRSP